MPSLTIHLLAAYKYNPRGSTEFFVGSLAPDAVSDRADKDRTHMRDIPVSERPAALAALALRLDLSRDLEFGILLHLYTDYMWDTTLQKRYIETFGPGWFLPYREHIGIAGAWIYHHDPEIERIWKEVADAVSGDLKIAVCDAVCGAYNLECDKKRYAECGDVKSLILYNYHYNKDNDIGSSSAFPPGDVDRFAADTAAAFMEFLHRVVK